MILMDIEKQRPASSKSLDDALAESKKCRRQSSKSTSKRRVRMVITRCASLFVLWSLYQLFTNNYAPSLSLSAWKLAGLKAKSFPPSHHRPMNLQEREQFFL